MQPDTFVVESIGRRERRRRRRDERGPMTIKASSLLSIVAIWAMMGAAVAKEPDQWPALIFAFFATCAIGASAWRRLGISRMVAIAGIWAGTALGAAYADAGLFLSIFAFLSTGAVVYSSMHRDALLNGIGAAAPWVVTGIVVAVNGDGGAWIAIFAFLTSSALAHTYRGEARGIAAVFWWGLAGAIMIIGGGGAWYWLCVPALILTETSLGINEISLPRGIEWDIFGRGSESD